MIVDHRNVRAALQRLALPSALAMTGDQFLGIADTIAIGSLGAAPLAGIAAATSVFVTLAIGLFAFGAGPRIMGAQAIGNNDTERFGAIARASFVAPIFIALAIALGSFAFARPLMGAMLGQISSRDAASFYLILRCISLVPIVISSGIIAAFSAAGEARLAVRTLIVINIVHLPLLFVLALGVGTGTRLGLTGAGISSLIAEIVGCIFCIVSAVRNPQFRIFTSRSVDRALAWTATVLALPEFVFLLLLLVPDPITIGLLSPLGAVAVAAFRALTVVSDLTWALPGSLGDAAEIVIAQRLGARDIEGARWFRVRSTRAAVLLCGSVAVVGAACAWPLAAAVTLNASLASLAAAPLALHLMTLPLKGYALTMLAPIRASGDTKFSMWLGVATSLIVVSGIALGVRYLHIGLWSVPIAWLCAWSVRALLTWVRLRTGDWERRLLPV